jgi:hypothetical protein
MTRDSQARPQEFTPMSIVGPQQRVASAFTVQFGKYGDVTHYARDRGVCRQRVYREAADVLAALDDPPGRQENARLRQRVRQLEDQLADAQRHLAQAVVLDADKQAEFASVGQALGVSLPECRELLEVLRPGQALSVATLGRRTQAAARRAGQLLPVFDAWVREQVQQVAADEIYVTAPVRMVVEPESLCWVSGQVGEEVSGPVWAQEFRQLPHLEQVTRDGGTSLAKGVALVNAERPGRPVVDQGDHWHALRGGGTGLWKAEQRARQALTAAEAAEQALAACRRQGQAETGPRARARAAWRRAAQALDTWTERQRLWQQTKAALRLFTPEGELNTRERATARLTETLSALPDSDFAKTKRALQKPEMLAYLDRVQRQVEALPFAPEVKRAAVRQEGLRRQPELLQGAGPGAGALRGVLLACAVVLSKVGAEGQEAVAAVREICRRAYRASSLVECINSVLRMQQARHRKLTQGLLDLKRLYWNSHTFRTGRRRKTTPYQRLGVPWPEGLRWWDVLKLTPEQLRNKLSTAKAAA